MTDGEGGGGRIHNLQYGNRTLFRLNHNRTYCIIVRIRPIENSYRFNSLSKEY